MSWTAAMRGNEIRAVQRVPHPSEAPATEYVEIPDGSSSAAPVTRPGPSSTRNPCIPRAGFRFSNGLYRWEFEKGRAALTVSLQGPASFDDPDLVIQAALDGVGIGTAMEDTLTGLIAEGGLVQVLRDWCTSFPGYFLYYPSRRNQPAALAALIHSLRLD
jgi:DNA-binding transcriptional LysR family regulator